MKLQFAGMQPSLAFGKKEESDRELRTRHFQAAQSKRAKQDDKPGSWGYMDTITIRDGKEVRQHLDLTGEQATQMVQQALTMQMAMWRHEMAHLEFPSLLAPMEEDEFVRSDKSGKKHDVLKR